TRKGNIIQGGKGRERHCSAHAPSPHPPSNPARAPPPTTRAQLDLDRAPGRRAMAFLFGALLGLVLGVGVVMAFARIENSRAEQRRQLAATVSSFSKLSVQDLKTLIPTEAYPSWVSFNQKQNLNG
uniref:Uncharacterized protein n=1 Tax=Triticum urartu TaxID=4572 RepID=A0A8R7QKY8_TRIUA